MKIWFLAFTLPSMVFAYSPTSSQDCTPLDLRADLGKVRDQHEMAWCYAFTGADMLGKAFATPEKISAADIAINYNESKLGRASRWLDVNLIHRNDSTYPRLAHQTGFNKFSLQSAMKEGWCPESVFPSETWTKMTKTLNGWEKSQVPLEVAMLEISTLHDIRRSLKAESLPFYYSFKNVDADQFVDLLQQKKVAAFYFSLRETVCRNDRHPYPDQFKTKMMIKNAQIFKTVSEHMEAGRVVALDYDSHILEDSSSRGLSFSKFHTSALVGRRWNSINNSCEFLIRNSHGDKCDSKYDPSYDCEEGNVWIEESKIYSTMSSIVYMLSGNP